MSYLPHKEQWPAVPENDLFTSSAQNRLVKKKKKLLFSEKEEDTDWYVKMFVDDTHFRVGPSKMRPLSAPPPFLLLLIRT